MNATFKNIFQEHLPITPWKDAHLKRLPGLNPMARVDWIIVDDAYDRQMAYVDHLLDTKRDAVLMMDDSAEDAGRELLEHVLAAVSLIDGYRVGDDYVVRPDGASVTLDREQALLTSRSLVQQDFCLMLQVGAEHVLGGGAMCFPASWTLGEKFMRPMTGIHEPVDEFDNMMATRVERMFQMMRPEQDMYRANWLVYNDPDLHQPRRNGDGRPRTLAADQWIRVERQALCKLPKSRAIVFGIHSYVVPFGQLNAEQRASLADAIKAKASHF
jgi:hypothetical protein